jgi:phenylacetate-coenzyme A ligase PaaK-like adenylate-forming protein
LDTFKSFESLLPSVNAQTFEQIALDIFQFQAKENETYKKYIAALKVNVSQIGSLDQIPFLPIRFFKSHNVKTGAWPEEEVFTSSGTTGSKTSHHPVFDLKAYHHLAEKSFESFFGPLKNYHLLALLPSYQEQGHSSLVSMVDHFIRCTQSSHSGFYLHNDEQLLQDVKMLKHSNRKVLVWGVTYALLDIAEKYGPDWRDVLIMETGGMKGRRQEITREALHEKLRKTLCVTDIYSEYGMTELLSQGYTRGKNLFFPGNSLKIMIRDVTDPLRKGLLSETGGINVIDLANFRTVSFIETEDLGKVHENGSFEVLGRIDNSEIRGCNLLVE